MSRFQEYPQIAEVYQTLRKELKPFVEKNHWGSSIAGAYQPLDYAWEPFKEFLQLMGEGSKELMFLGMNPGPHGMTQTGVPFGSVNLVQSWLGINSPVGQPSNASDLLAVDGFAHRRQEVSGERFWGLMRERFGTPDAFFTNHSVHSFCPLVFFSTTGANVVPEHLERSVREAVLEICTRAPHLLWRVWQPRTIVALGNWAQARALVALKTFDSRCRPDIIKVPHPSPASPLSKNWAFVATEILVQAGLW